MALKVDAETLVLAALIALTVFAWMFSLNASGVKLSEIVMLGKLGENLDKVLSLPFYAFLLLFPLTLALVASFSEVKEKENMHLASAVGLVLGGFAALFLFKNLVDFAWPLTFYALSVFLFIEIVYWYLSTVKGNALVKAITAGYGYVALLISFGVFASIALAVNGNPATYLNDFESAVVSNSLVGAGTRALVEENASLVIINQRMLLDGLLETEEYQKLGESLDPRVAAFAKKVQAKKLELGSKAYRKEVVERLKAKKPVEPSEAEKQSAFATLKARVPLFAVIEKNFWFVVAFVFTSMFYLLTKFVFKPLLIIYTVLLDKALKFAYTQLLLNSNRVTAYDEEPAPPEERKGGGQGWI